MGIIFMMECSKELTSNRVQFKIKGIIIDESSLLMLTKPSLYFLSGKIFKSLLVRFRDSYWDLLWLNEFPLFLLLAT
jgi:hypothetical protein